MFTLEVVNNDKPISTPKQASNWHVTEALNINYDESKFTIYHARCTLTDALQFAHGGGIMDQVPYSMLYWNVYIRCGLYLNKK